MANCPSGLEKQINATFASLIDSYKINHLENYV